jgi:hypothetical protein
MLRLTPWRWVTRARRWNAYADQLVTWEHHPGFNHFPLMYDATGRQFR